jgi:hypothetical protein
LVVTLRYEGGFVQVQLRALKPGAQH